MSRNIRRETEVAAFPETRDRTVVQALVADIDEHEFNAKRADIFAKRDALAVQMFGKPFSRLLPWQKDRVRNL